MWRSQYPNESVMRRPLAARWPKRAHAGPVDLDAQIDPFGHGVAGRTSGREAAHSGGSARMS